MIDKLKEIVDAVIKVDEKLGFKKFTRYVFSAILIMLIFNYKTVLRDFIEIVSDITEDIHLQKMELRDQLLAELYPILGEFRSEVKADRILYFEYHNSNENLVSIPFKYFELVQQNTKYSIPRAQEEKYKNINVGAITSIYEDIKLGGVVYCGSPTDNNFMNKYPGVFDLVHSRDGSRRHVYMSIPGINQPIGLLIIEWMNESETDIDVDAIKEVASDHYIPRINALILSKRR